MGQRTSQGVRRPAATRSAARRPATPGPARGRSGRQGPARARRPGFGAVAVHTVSLVAAGAFLLWLNRDQWFQSDEFDFLADRGVLGAPARGLFEPHNEHWSTLPILAYRLLYAFAGLTTYWPYALLLVTVHLGVTHLLWRTARRAGADAWVATALAAVFLLFGAGWENLLWAFQSAFLASVLVGLLHLGLVDRDGPVGRADRVGAAVACLGLACSGVGVPMVAATGVAVALRRGLRAGLTAVGLPAAVFLAWFLGAGRAGVDGGALAPVTLPQVLGFVLDGARGALHGLARAGPAGDALGLLLLGGIVFALWRDRRRAAAPLGLAVGALVFLALAGAGRSGAQGDATSSRYAYVTLALLLPALALALSAAGARLPTPWRAPAILALTAVLMVPGARLLLAQAQVHGVIEQAWRARIVAAADLGAREPELVVDPAVTVDLSVDELVRMRGQGTLPPIIPDAQAVAEARALLGVGLAEQEPGAAGPGLPGLQSAGPPPAVVALRGGVLVRAGDRCQRLDPVAGPAEVTLDIGAPTSVQVRTDGPSAVGVTVEEPARGTRAMRPRTLSTSAAGPAAVRFGFPARVTLTFPEGGPTTLCGVR